MFPISTVRAMRGDVSGGDCPGTHIIIIMIIIIIIIIIITVNSSETRETIFCSNGLGVGAAV